MKNVFLVPTDKPSYLFIIDKSKMFKPEAPYLSFSTVGGRAHKIEGSDLYQPQNIYITSNEEIKEGDNVILKSGRLTKAEIQHGTLGFKTIDGVAFLYFQEGDKKVIITTDQELINEGIQALTDEQIMEYINNPVDYVEVEKEIQAFDGLNRPIANAVLFDDYIKEIYSVSFSPKNIVDKLKDYLKNTPREEVLSDWHEAKREAPKGIKYSKLLLEFETMEGITSNMFDEKDWSRFDRFIKSREKNKCKGSFKDCFNPLNECTCDEMERETHEESVQRGFIRISKEIDYTEFDWKSFEHGAKWQEEKMYSEEEVYNIIEQSLNNYHLKTNKGYLKQWFEQFKKK